MACTEQDGADQPTLEEETRSTPDSEQTESTHHDVAGDAIPDRNEGATEDSTQRSIRGMLEDGGESSIFVSRALVDPDTIIDEVAPQHQQSLNEAQS